MPVAMSQPNTQSESEAADRVPAGVTLEDGRQFVTLRLHGPARFGGAAFLAVWLCGWLLGEVFALVTLVGALLATFAPGLLDALGLAGKFPGPTGGGAAFVVVFLSFWLTIWTFGGVAAMRELMRLVAASDRIGVGGGELELDQRLGPFRSRQRLALTDIQKIAVDHRGAMVASTKDGAVIVSALGTPQERASVARWLRRSLVPSRGEAGREADLQRQRDTLPAGWESAIDEAGAGVLLRRSARTTRRQATVLYGFAIASGLGFVGAVVPVVRGEAPTAQLFGALSALALGAALTLGGSYLHAGGRVLAVFPGRFDVRRFLFDRWRVSPRTVSTLALEASRESDGDVTHRLRAHGARSFTVAATAGDPGELLHLGRWLAARLGVRFDAPKELVDE